MADKLGMVHLTAEEIARTVIEVTPVARGALLVPRQYTATVQANENELAEVTHAHRGPGGDGVGGGERRRTGGDQGIVRDQV